MAPPRRPWFRFYVEAIHDRKIRRLPPSQRWLWVVVLSVARSSPKPGYLVENGKRPPSAQPVPIDCPVSALTDRDLADLAALQAKDVRAGLVAFAESGLLTFDSTVGAYYVTRWNERQFESDDVTQRTAKHRSKAVPLSADATAMERSKNGDGTAPDTDTDTDTEPPLSPPARPSVATNGAGGGGSHHDPRIGQALALLVAAEERHAGQLRNPDRWRRTVLARLTDERTDLAGLADEHPDWTPEQLAGLAPTRPRVFHEANLEPVDHAAAKEALRQARGDI